MTDPITAGRDRLADWFDGGTDDVFASATTLRALQATGWTPEELQRRAGPQQAFGRAIAGRLDGLVRENNLHRNLPVLDPYDGIGRRSSPVRHHPSYAQAGEIIYGSGVMAAYGESPTPHRYILSLFYLSSHVGEGGHNCPLACTAGAIRSLQELGTPEQKARYLPPLLDPDYTTNHTAAQFLTEVQGGSDVGANGCRAERAADGSWRVSGEKWFCSNIDADVILMTARPVGAADGTRGLALFLVPARLPDGRFNHLRVRRLKDKLGTRSMASAEVDFEGAVAESVGPVDGGFKNAMELVITTSRLYNAFGCAGVAWRAWLEARRYAEHRRAFGQPIGAFPLVAETLAMMQADAEASLAGCWLLAGLQEKLDQGVASDDERAFHRVAINLNKLRTAVTTHDVVLRGIEVLGGNGAIESFSVLPRLLRDNVVYENWEGTHNTLRVQVLRDCRRLGLHAGFFRVLRALGETDGLEVDEQAFEAALTAEDGLATLMMRPLADRLATRVQLAGLRPVLADPGRAARARLTRKRHISSLPATNQAYFRMIEEAGSQDGNGHSIDRS